MWIGFCDQAGAVWYRTIVLYFLNTKLYSSNRDWYSDWMETELQAVTYNLSLNQEVFRLQHEIGRKSHIGPKQNFALNYAISSFHSSDVTGWSLTAEGLVRSRTNSCPICGEQSGTGIFSSTHIFSPCQLQVHIFSVFICLHSRWWNAWALEVAVPQVHRLTPVPEYRDSVRQHTSFW